MSPSRLSLCSLSLPHSLARSLAPTLLSLSFLSHVFVDAACPSTVTCAMPSGDTAGGSPRRGRSNAKNEALFEEEDDNDLFHVLKVRSAPDWTTLDWIHEFWLDDGRRKQSPLVLTLSHNSCLRRKGGITPSNIPDPKSSPRSPSCQWPHSTSEFPPFIILLAPPRVREPLPALKPGTSKGPRPSGGGQGGPRPRGGAPGQAP